MLITNAELKFESELVHAFEGAREIDIATAYVSPGACEALALIARSRDIPIRLSLGRAMQDGLGPNAKSYLEGLDRVAAVRGGGVRVDPVGWHSKLYASEAKAFIGSSNLTEHGLSGWTEANLLVSATQATSIRQELSRLWDGGIPYRDLADDIPVISVRRSGRGKKYGDHVVQMPTEPGQSELGIEISLLDRNGEVPPLSGLNWGLAGGRVRDRYECYIRFPTKIHEEAQYIFGSNHKGTVFIARTHTGKEMKLCLEGNSKKGEDAAKQISTSGDKSALGKWMIEDCLRIYDQREVTTDDLRRYGRTSVEFYRSGTEPDGTAIVYVDFSRR